MLERAVRSSIVALVLASPAALAAQSGKGGSSPSAAAVGLMNAIADSNLTRMSELFGNTKGPVAKTRPTGYEKKLVIMQAMLRGVHATAHGDITTKDGVHAVTTELEHNGCKATISINTVHSSTGWLVHDFDLEQASKINQPCQHAQRPGN
ncbi:MAG TPA: hypothetical protein VGM20_14095 [Gemmatimonadales bacterium]|jgi:hypothetical protein